MLVPKVTSQDIENILNSSKKNDTQLFIDACSLLSQEEAEKALTFVRGSYTLGMIIIVCLALPGVLICFLAFLLSVLGMYAG